MSNRSKGKNNTSSFPGVVKSLKLEPIKNRKQPKPCVKSENDIRRNKSPDDSLETCITKKLLSLSVNEEVPKSSSAPESYNKHHKAIKFTNQVTVLYFNGDDILCESMEPLKKEQEQQLRNKEMRKEHLLSKGPADNLYLF